MKLVKKAVQLDGARKGDSIPNDNSFQSALDYFGKNVKTLETLERLSKAALPKEFAADLEAAKLETKTLNEKLMGDQRFKAALDYVFLMISE